MSLNKCHSSHSSLAAILPLPFPQSPFPVKQELFLPWLISGCCAPASQGQVFGSGSFLLITRENRRAFQRWQHRLGTMLFTQIWSERPRAPNSNLICRNYPARISECGELRKWSGFTEFGAENKHFFFPPLFCTICSESCKAAQTLSLAPFPLIPASVGG